MGCLMVAVSALLALAVPASIAKVSLVGSYVVIAVLAVLAATTVSVNRRRQRAVAPSRSAALVRIGVLTVLYAVTCTVIHVAH